jgi:hypothetical protein
VNEKCGNEQPSELFHAAFSFSHGTDAAAELSVLVIINHTHRLVLFFPLSVSAWNSAL